MLALLRPQLSFFSPPMLHVRQWKKKYKVCECEWGAHWRGSLVTMTCLHKDRGNNSDQRTCYHHKILQIRTFPYVVIQSQFKWNKPLMYCSRVPRNRQVYQWKSSLCQSRMWGKLRTSNCLGVFECACVFVWLVVSLRLSTRPCNKLVTWDSVDQSPCKL